MTAFLFDNPCQAVIFIYETINNEVKMIDFLNPEYYDVSDITDDMPNKELLTSLFERMNEQNERLWMFFTEMNEDPGHKRMTAEAIKPRTLRKKKGKRKPREYTLCKETGRLIKKSRPVDNQDSEEFEAGYKEFLANEFNQS